MITAWTQHIKDKDEKVQYQKSLLHSRWILDRQTELLEELLASLERQEISPSAYDNQNWAYRQAHSNGYKQAIKQILRLNDLTPKDPNDRQPTATE